ncbi:MAG: hypothetical protein Q8R88_03175 [Desulfoprunum sp.]|nr:hypothetical protein [Desulfoprunum sp.]
MTRTHQLFTLTITLFFCVFISQASAYAQEGQAALLERLTADIAASTQLNDTSKELVKSKLLPITVNPILVAEVKAQNNKKVSLETIKKVDDEWKAKEGDVPLLEELKANTTAKELNRLIKGIPEVVECFVMDNQGANVGQYNDTSDYWQGDEPKWAKSFNGGKGGVEIGKKEIDQSTALAQQQISLPLIDADGAVVGAITLGISVAK